MAVVFSSDLSGGSISSVVSMLETEAEDAQNLINAINSFIEGTKSSLTGKGYDMARQKMSMYIQDLKVRKQVAMDLANAISQGASSLLGYMEEFSKLDDSEIIELENEKVKRQIAESNVLTKVTGPMPNLLISFDAKRLETTVPSETKTVIKFA